MNVAVTKLKAVFDRTKQRGRRCWRNLLLLIRAWTWKKALCTGVSRDRETSLSIAGQLTEVLKTQYYQLDHEMSNIYATMKSCLYKSPGPEQVEVITNADDIKETDAPEYTSNKKTDEVTDPSKQPSLLWRMSSGIYSTASGAVGYGYGGVKWVAGKTYDVGSTVVSKVPKPPIPFVKKKDKNE